MVDLCVRFALSLALLLLLCARTFSQTDASAIAIQLTHPSIHGVTLSPDGERMIYVSNVNGRGQLFLSTIDGKRARPITTDDADHEDPAWSPDGKWIAYVRINDTLEVLELTDPNGGSRKRLTPPTLRVLHPSWSPDGKHILFCTNDDLRPPYKNASTIYSLNVSSGEMKVLVTGGVNTFPVLSPDGKTLAFRRMLGEMNSEVFISNADGTAPKNLTSHPAFDGWPSWSPDGSRIAFSSNRNANYQIFIMDKDGGNVMLLANTEGRATVPRWSPDGRAIFFTICKKVDFGRDCNIFVVDLREEATRK